MGIQITEEELILGVQITLILQIQDWVSLMLMGENQQTAVLFLTQEVIQTVGLKMEPMLDYVM